MKKVFDKVLIVMFENQYRSYVMKDPYMRKLAAAGCNMNNYFGAFHPSQTNYIASLSGEVCAVSNDTPPASPLMQETLVNLMQPGSGKAKVSWKAYMEAFPMALDKWNKAWENPNYAASLQPITEYPADGVNLARYFRKHNAFASFHDIQSVENKWNQIADEFTFWNDVYQNDLPEYSWFTPDIWNDGHYVYNTHVSTNPRVSLVGQLSAWLEYVFFASIDTDKVQGGTNFGQEKIGLKLDLDLVLTDPKKAYAQSNIPEGTLVVVTWDEADFDANGYDTNYDGQNQVYTVLLGDMITPGSTDDTPYNHYSLIKTIENNFDLGSLNKNDKDSNWFRFLWDEKFAWSAPKETNIISESEVATAYYNNRFGMVYQDEKHNLIWSTFNGKEWSTGVATGLQSSGNIALASIGKELMLVFTDDKASLQYATFNGTAWSKAQSLGGSQVGYIALTSYDDYNDGVQKLILAWQDQETDCISSLIYSKGAWQTEAESVGQLTDGPITASSLGGSVYLVYKERNTYQMRMTSYNTAPFNAFKAHDFKDNLEPANDTSLHQWSPMDFAVGHFSKKLNQHQDDYIANGRLAMSTIEGEMHLAYRKRYNDTPQLSTTLFGLTGIMTARSEETNGYGTLNQAGWTREVIHKDIELDPNSANAMSSSGTELMQVYQESGGNTLLYRTASYVKK